MFMSNSIHQSNHNISCRIVIIDIPSIHGALHRNCFTKPTFPCLKMATLQSTTLGTFYSMETWFWEECSSILGFKRACKLQIRIWQNNRFWFTHWGRVMHICVSKLPITGSANGFSPGRRQAIIWTNTGMLLIRTLRTNFSEILSQIHAF